MSNLLVNKEYLRTKEFQAKFWFWVAMGAITLAAVFFWSSMVLVKAI